MPFFNAHTPNSQILHLPSLYRKVFIEVAVRKKAKDKSHKISKGVRYAANIFKRHGGFIRNVLHFRLKDKSKADDIYQDLFLSLATKQIPKKPSNAKWYLYRAINNDIIDSCRKTKREKAGLKKYAQRHQHTYKNHCLDIIVSNAEEVRNLFAVVESNLYKREINAIKLKWSAPVLCTSYYESISHAFSLS